MKLLIILFVAIAAFRAAARDPERVQAGDGKTIVREFSDDDSLKSVSHFDAKGELLDTLYYAPTGIPTHLDSFDDRKCVTSTQTLKDDGTPIGKYHFDEHGNTVFVESFTFKDGKGAADSLPATDRLKFLTTAGNISFTVDGAWKIMTLQPQLPIATVGFQIQNPADESAPDSTNFAVSLYDASSDPASKAAKKALGGLLVKGSDVKVKKTRHGDWEQWSYPGKQDKTSCQVLDADKKIGGVIVGLRLAWPKLPKKPANYDASMEAIFLSVLDSVAEEK